MSIIPPAVKNTPSTFVLPTELRFERGPMPVVKEQEREAVSRWWHANKSPESFDGDIVGVHELRIAMSGPGLGVEIVWHPSLYSFYAASRVGVPSAPSTPSLYAAVVLRTDEGMCFGLMHPSTNAGARIQAPGGTVNLPEDGQTITTDYCRHEAARELAEETGFDLAADQLRLMALKLGGENNDVGVFFESTVVHPAAEIRATFATHLDTIDGTPELTNLLFANSPSELIAQNEGKATVVDYVLALLNAHDKYNPS